MKSDQKKYTFLIVDDSDLIRKMLKDFFHNYNVEVITCSDGLEGIKVAADANPDLIFLDLLMPNLDGLKTIQVIKMIKILRDIPVIVISGNTNRANVMAAHEAGAERVISKPLNKEIIIRNVKELLGDDFHVISQSKTNVLEENDAIHLRKFFINSFKTTSVSIRESLNTKNTEMLKNLIHDLKGTGSMIGYPAITSVSREIENKLENYNIDWSFIRIKIEQIFSIVKEIENSIQMVDK